VWDSGTHLFTSITDFVATIPKVLNQAEVIVNNISPAIDKAVSIATSVWDTFLAPAFEYASFLLAAEKRYKTGHYLQYFSRGELIYDSRKHTAESYRQMLAVSAIHFPGKKLKCTRSPAQLNKDARKRHQVKLLLRARTRQDQAKQLAAFDKDRKLAVDYPGPESKRLEVKEDATIRVEESNSPLMVITATDYAALSAPPRALPTPPLSGRAQSKERARSVAVPSGPK